MTPRIVAHLKVCRDTLVPLLQGHTPADWRRTIEVNLNSQFYCTRLAVPLNSWRFSSAE